MRICITILVIFFGLAGMLSSARGSRKCRNPKGNAGDTPVSGCLERVCSRFGRKHVWLDSFATSVCCSYQRIGYPKGSTITSEKAEDGCTNVTLTCQDEKGMPVIKMKVESDCDTVTFVETLEEKATTSATITSTTPMTATPVNTAPSTSEPAGGQTADKGITPGDVLDFTVKDNKKSRHPFSRNPFSCCLYGNFKCRIACSGKPCTAKCTYRCWGKVCNPITCEQANPYHYHCVPATITTTPPTTTTTATITTTTTTTTTTTNETGAHIICNEKLQELHVLLFDANKTTVVHCCANGTTQKKTICGNGTECASVCGAAPTCAKVLKTEPKEEENYCEPRDPTDIFQQTYFIDEAPPCTGSTLTNCKTLATSNGSVTPPPPKPNVYCNQTVTIQPGVSFNFTQMCVNCKAYCVYCSICPPVFNDKIAEFIENL